MVIHEFWCGCVAKVDPKTRRVVKVIRICKKLEADREKSLTGAVARHLGKELRKRNLI